MYIPEDIINQIKSRANIVETIGEYVHLKQSGQNYKGLCPFHTEKTPSFIVSPQKGIYHCFGCGAGGNVFNFIMKFRGISFPDAVRFLGERLGVRVESSVTGGRKKGHAHTLYEIISEAASFCKKNLFSSSGKEALAYLKKRAFTIPAIEVFHIGFAPDSWDSQFNYLKRRGFSPPLIEEAGMIVKKKGGNGYYDRFRNRIMFPIQDSIGRFIGFGGRILGNNLDTPKYINTQENEVFHKGKHLYGLYQAEGAIRENDSVFIVEGYIDAIRMHAEGIQNTVAPLGTAFTADHVSLILRYTRNIYIMFDPDPAGINAVLRSIVLMHKRGMDPYIMRLPLGNDPGDFFDSYTRKDFDLLMKDSVTGIDFIVQHFTGAKKEYTANEKIVILQAISEYYINMNDEILRDEFLVELSEALNVECAVLKREIAKFTQIHVSSGKEPSSQYKKSRSIDTELYLLLLVLNNPDLFHIAQTRLDESYFHGKWTKMLWKAILRAQKIKTWDSSTVFSYVDDEKFVEYLSGRLIEEILNNNPEEQLIDVVATLKEIRLKEQLSVVNEKLKKAELENNEQLETELMVEKATFRDELEKIRLLRTSKAQL